jgi:hypothetical protein
MYMLDIQATNSVTNALVNLPQLWRKEISLIYAPGERIRDYYLRTYSQEMRLTAIAIMGMIVDIMNIEIDWHTDVPVWKDQIYIMYNNTSSFGQNGYISQA